MTGLSEIVRTSLSDVCREKHLFDGAVRLDHSLVDDLGFDSLTFVDLIVILEERTALEDLPLLDWADREAMRKTGRYSVQSLVDAIEAYAKRRA
jgi:acyl carrier protein